MAFNLDKKYDDAREDNIRKLYKLYELAREIEDSSGSLLKFVKLAWPYIDPAPYIHSWHIEAICEHLEAMTDGHIRKLIINVPPRSGKSNLIAVLWPAWVWIKQPDQKWIFSSYDVKLAQRHSRTCRQLIKSPWYQRNWGQNFKISPESDKIGRFDNDKLGFRVATSSNAGILGEGADYLVQDDPNDLREMNSDAYVESVIFNHEHVLSSRLNDRKTGRRLIVQQRASERDLSGHVLAHETGWEHLCIPMEYEGDTRRTSIGWQDSRKELGELMCPARFGPLDAAEEKKRPMIWAGQYQQRPAPSEGAKFKRQWWNFYNPPGTEMLEANGVPKQVEIRVPGGEVIRKVPVTLPEAFEQVCHGWDMNFKELEHNDFVSGHVWGRVGSRSFLLARDTRHLDFPQTLQAMRKMSREFPCPEKMVEGKANGPAVIQTLRNEIPGLIESPIDGGLSSLANSMTGYCEAGNWYLPNPNLFPWVLEFIEIFAAYPNGKHDDDVAACCHANRRLFDSISNAAAPEFRVAPRIGEPESACHVVSEASKPAPHWRKWIAVSPGEAAVWIAETPEGSLRVYREMAIDGIDAAEVGRRIGEATLPDVRERIKAIHATAKWNIDIFSDKTAFAPIEPVGSYAEMLEHGLLSYVPDEGGWTDRELAKGEMRVAKFSTQLAEINDSVWDRLRDLLRFQPPDFKTLEYDRKQAYEIACKDIQEYKRYMAAVDGRVEGEWPKIKFSPHCTNLIQGLGGARSGEALQNPFVRALLIGVSAPRNILQEKRPKEIPWNNRTMLRHRAANAQLLQRAI